MKMALSSKRVAIGGGLLLVVVAAGLIGFWAGGLSRDPASSATGGREVLYWYDPMVPAQHFDKPGKSPFMDMQLVPRYAGEADPQTGVRIDPGVTQNLGVRYAIVEKGDVSGSIRAVGVLSYADRDVAIVQAKQEGFVERGRGRAVGDVVRAGDALADIRVPAWTAALAEYLSLRSGPDASLTAAARQRLGMLGVPGDATRAAEASGAAPAVFTIRTPISGSLTALDIRDGMAIGTGAAIARINALSPVWLTVSVPQGGAGSLRAGGRADARFSTYPGDAFIGRIETILPTANVASRAVEVRIALSNADGRLRPGMTGEVHLSDPNARIGLVLPSEAVIRTGRRAVVIVAADGGRFEPVEVLLGSETGGRIEILSGLSEGQRVVASGQFLIDSEASLAGAIGKLQGSASGVTDGPYTSSGQITAIDAAGVTIAHTPVEQLNWPAMTMVFAWGSGGQQKFSVGDQVTFTFHKGGAGYVIDTIVRAGTPR